MIDIENRYWAAQGIVRAAGRIAAELYHRRAELTIERKGIQDLVSEADRQCEDMIIGKLKRLFPDDGFLGEERGRQNMDAEAIWIIDPIDGTANFLRGIPLWCVSLGLLVGGEFVIGIIYNPITEELYAACKGMGATLNGKPIKASAVISLEEARIGVGFNHRESAAVHGEAVARILDARGEYSRLGSGALGLAFTADGRLDGFFEEHINVWDVAAGLCIVKEAGGRINDFLADDGIGKGNHVLASAPGLYTALSSLLKVSSP